MFPIDEFTPADNLADVALIAHRYEVLHFDDAPVLFTGVNRYGARILGSSIDRDRAVRATRALHVLVPETQYACFLRGTLSYLDILKNSESVFIIDRFADADRPAIHLGALADIQEKHRPLAGSFCPPREYAGTLDYVSVLNGPRASEHRATSTSVVAVADNLSHVLRDAVRSILPNEDFDVEIALEAASFEMRFSVRLNRFPFDTYTSYLKKYLEYCLNHFPQESESVGKHDVEHAPLFRELAVLQNTMRRTSDHDRSLIASIERSVRGFSEISQVVADGDTTVGVYTGEKVLVGIIDENTTEIQDEALSKFDVAAQRQKVDASPSEYQILVYSLNKESRKGIAYVLSKTSPTMPRARIHIAGTDSLDGSPFTQSMDQSSRITVKGKATTRNGVVTKLRILSAE